MKIRNPDFRKQPSITFVTILVVVAAAVSIGAVIASSAVFNYQIPPVTLT